MISANYTGAISSTALLIHSGFMVMSGATEDVEGIGQKGPSHGTFKISKVSSVGGTERIS